MTDDVFLRLAQTFHYWKQLADQAEHDPEAVSAEQLSSAWAAVMDAYEAWLLAQ